MKSVVIKKILATYVYNAMVAWVPLANHYERDNVGHWQHTKAGYYQQEDQDAVRARYELTAQNVVDVAFDDANPPIFAGNDDDGRLKTALQLAGMASFEGHFDKLVENGVCNSHEFQAHEHELMRANPHYHPMCDGGVAYSNWQIHVYNFVIKDGVLLQAPMLEHSAKKEDRDWIAAHRDDIITGPKLIADPHLAALVAYYLMRSSLHRTHSLCEYTGESCTDGHHPLALLRSERPVVYLRSHPFTVPADDEVQLAAVDPGSN